MNEPLNEKQFKAVIFDKVIYEVVYLELIYIAPPSYNEEVLSNLEFMISIVAFNENKPIYIDPP